MSITISGSGLSVGMAKRMMLRLETRHNEKSVQPKTGSWIKNKYCRSYQPLNNFIRMVYYMHLDDNLALVDPKMIQQGLHFFLVWSSRYFNV